MGRICGRKGQEKEMLEIIFVVVLFVIVFGATGFGWWYEIFGPDEEKKE